MTMSTTRPYLVRAFYEWIVDNGCTPHIVVNSNAIGVEVPQEYANEGQIVLNISLRAVQTLSLGNNAIEFQARFGGRVRRIYAPISSILAIYAKENGRGMVFAEEETHPPLPAPPPPIDDTREPLVSTDKDGNGKKNGKGKGSGKPPHLTVVK